ncbi:MAG: archease [Acidobacteria bacterium]|nr:archease [Acidobacteriota bacterium]
MAPEFELLEHTSDVGVLARGATREEALIAASRGLASILANPETIRPIEERYFKAAGGDEAAQIVNWLNEILFFFDTEGLVFAEFEITSWSASEIMGHARGEFLDTARHEFRAAVKAATYHQFESRATTGGWEIRVFVDV